MKLNGLGSSQTMWRELVPAAGHPEGVHEPGDQEEIPEVGAQVSSRQEPE